MGIAKKILLFVLLVLFLIGVTTPVMALGGQYDELFYSNNDILGYNPEDSTCGTVDSAASASGYLASKGISSNTADAIKATFTGKTPFDTSDFNSGSYGIIPLPYGTLRTQFETNLKAAHPDLYDTYYNAAADTSKASVGDSNIFLNGQLDVLYNWANTTTLSGIDNIDDRMTQADTAYTNYSSSTTAVRIFYQSDGTTLIYSDMKANTVLDALSEIGGQQAQALAWMYLWTPDYKSITTAQVKTVLDSLSVDSTDSESSSGCASAGEGGLDFEQAKALVKKYIQTVNTDLQSLPELSFFWSGNSGGCTPGTCDDECTTFVGWFGVKFSPTGTLKSAARGNGVDKAGYMAADNPSLYTSTTDTSQITPYTVWSFGKGSSNGEPGHTGVIVGVGDDGSVITAEGNWNRGNSDNSYSFGTKGGATASRDDGVASAKQWASIDDFISSMKASGYTFNSFAVPTDPTTIGQKLSDWLNS